MNRNRSTYVRTTGVSNTLLYGSLAVVFVLVVALVLAPQFIMAAEAIKSVTGVLGG